MCDPLSKSNVKQEKKATVGWLRLGQEDPYVGSSELLGEELCVCVLAKLIPGAHGAVPQCVPGPARVPSEFCFSFWLGSVVEAQSECGVLSMSVFQSLGDWLLHICKAQGEFYPFSNRLQQSAH